jgi:hypothetical protein
MTPPARPSHRHNGIVSFTDALASRFPVCRALVGDELFQAMAASFMKQSPVRSPVLTPYEDAFCDFIGTFPSARSVPYLADVARLESALFSASHAEHTPPLTVDELASLAPCRWDQMRVELLPSVRIVTSRYAIVSVWEAHVRGRSPFAIDSSVPEDALVARPDLEAEIHRLHPGGALFVSKLLGDATLGAAASAAARADRRFDLITSLSGLFRSRVVVGLRRACRRSIPRVRGRDEH